MVVQKLRDESGASSLRLPLISMPSRIPTDPLRSHRPQSIYDILKKGLVFWILGLGRTGNP